MENFFYEDKFYSDLEDLASDMEIYEDTVQALPENWEITCMACESQKLVTLDADWIIERIDSERFPEESDRTEARLKKSLATIDFNKVNELIPSVWYPMDKDFKITKSDLVEHFK